MTEENSTPARRKLGEGVITMVDRLIDELSGPVRRTRQEAASALAEMCREHPETVEPDVERVTEALADALYRPEAQTRWEALDALACVAPTCADEMEDAFEGAETALFDELSSTLRYSAFHMLCVWGATSPERSREAWTILDEAIQCYHGDAEYRDMLQALLTMVQTCASDETKAALAERVAFDAANGTGYIKTFSAQIAEACK